MKMILRENGYPSPIIERVVDRALHPDPPVCGPKLKPIFIRLPWLGAPSLASRKILQHTTTSAIHWCRTICSFSSRTAFNTSGKDVLPAESISNVIYLFKCECDHTYVGRTIQRLEERVKKHVPKDLIESWFLTTTVLVCRPRESVAGRERTTLEAPCAHLRRTRLSPGI